MYFTSVQLVDCVTFRTIRWWQSNIIHISLIVSLLLFLIYVCQTMYAFNMDVIFIQKKISRMFIWMFLNVNLEILSLYIESQVRDIVYIMTTNIWFVILFRICKRLSIYWQLILELLFYSKFAKDSLYSDDWHWNCYFIQNLQKV